MAFNNSFNNNFMDYNLAKKLKEAGFPQKYGEMYKWINKDNSRLAIFSIEMYERYIKEEIDELPVYEPTLSELIDACGRDFSQVGRNFDEGLRIDEQWIALSTMKLHKFGNGKTIEEAVANLWIKLNKSPK